MNYEELLTFLHWKQTPEKNKILDIDRMIKTANSFKEKVKREIKFLEHLYLHSTVPKHSSNKIDLNPKSHSFGSSSGHKLIRKFTKTNKEKE